MDGLIFAIGGHSGPSRLNTVEYYDPSKNSWSSVCPLSVPRTIAGSSSIGGSIYVVGGYDGKEYLNSVESYDVEMDRWLPCPSMHVCRSAMGLVGLDGCLYACGGFNGNFEVSVEKYVSSTQSWEPCADMLIEKVHFGFAHT
jgi:kelch-like protein 18